MIGKRILHYKILEKIGAGGMGVVYKAEDTKLKRTVALKFLPLELTGDAEAKKRFVREAQAASALEHPNICNIHEIGETDDGQMFIVMACYEGQTLKERIGGGQSTVNEAIEISIQIAQGLARAHEEGIVHRDIKPANIIITDRNEVKILDFGLAKLTGQVQLTKDSSTLGTIAYMSPEQLSGKEVDKRTDIWSLGVLLYEMVTEHLPFDGEYEQAVIYSIMNEEPKAVSELREDVSDALAAIIERAIAKDQEARYSSADELLNDLRDFQRNEAAQNIAQVSITNLLRQPRFAFPAVFAVVVIGFLTIWIINRNDKADWARQQTISEIVHLIDEEKYVDAWRLAREAEQTIPNDPLIAQLLPQMTHNTSISTTPPGASIAIIEYENLTNSWMQLGDSPIDSIRIPRGFFRWKIEKADFESIEVAGASSSGAVNFDLDSTSTIPVHMVRVASGSVYLPFAGLFRREDAELESFLMDKFEVTNVQYKLFVDHGGYEKPEFWQHPFVKNGKQLSFEAAMTEFRDATGRPGPATWELGTYSEGKEDYPVAGVSWYEAAAYAEFVGKELPTVYHWARAASHSASPWLLPHSNFNGAGVQPIGGRANPGYFGTYDLAGNVREWCWNETSGTRFILGGAWNEPAYVFSFAVSADPFDRSAQNGFRCIKNLQKPSSITKIKVAFNSIIQRNFAEETPVSDKSFNLFKRFYSYDRSTLNAEIVLTDSVSSKHWIRTTVSIDAAYGNERMAVHLFLPKIGKPPFQTIILFPGANAFYRPSSERVEYLKSWDGVDFLPQSGRVVVYPVYKSLYERRDGYNLETMTPNSDREHFIFWRKDLGRTIDYLETRTDIDTSKLCYYGSSLGACVGPIFMALEKRIDLSIIRLGGLMPWKILPEADPFNFISHVSLPILILNGRYDNLFPYESCQKPFYDFLGTPAVHKRMVLFDVTHRSPRPRNKAIKETLDWLDRYFGQVVQ